MFYIILSFVFLGTTIGLILSNTINIFPEVFFYSWLIKKGFVPYRDYFDDHGFLLQMLLAPFTGDPTLLPLRIIYVILHCINLGLVLYILYKIHSKLAFVIGGTLYVLLITLFSDNDFWFELFVTTFYLLTYILLTTKQFVAKFHIVGFFIGLASLVKPTAAVLLLPIFLIRRNLDIILGFLFVIAITIVYFSFNNGLQGFYDGVIGYNMFYGRYLHPAFLQENKFITISLIIFLFCVFTIFLSKTVTSRILPILFTVSSYIFLASGYSPHRMVPIATFFALLIATTIPLFKRNIKILFVFFIIIYIDILIFKVYQHQTYLQTNRPPYISSADSQEIITFIKSRQLKEKFMILGDMVQPYYLLNQLPPTYIPLRFPLIEKYYPDYEQKLISDIQKNNIIYVFNPKTNKFSWNVIPTYLKKNYFLFSKSETLEVYKKISSL